VITKRLAAFGAIAAMAFAACSTGAPAGSAPPASSAAPASESAPAASASGSAAAAGVKAAALFPGLVDDGSWNQAGFEGLKKAESEAGATIAYTEKVTQDQQIEVFRNYAQQGNQVIIGHGGEYMDSALQVGGEFPEVQFVVTNGDKSAANVTSLALSYGDMGYLSGVLACSVTKSNKIGVVVGETIPIVNDSIKGWKDGCARVNPSAEVKTTATGDWADVDKAREAALALISDGADVVGHLLDAADAGVFAAADDKGVSAIGLYADESKLGPKSHIGAALADASQVVFFAVTKPLDGQVHQEGVKEGVVSFGAYAPSVPQSAQDAVKAAEDDLKSGAATF
jgi:basic membrane protein A and related proteins